MAETDDPYLLTLASLRLTLVEENQSHFHHPAGGAEAGERGVRAEMMRVYLYTSGPAMMCFRFYGGEKRERAESGWRRGVYRLLMQRVLSKNEIQKT